MKTRMTPIYTAIATSLDKKTIKTFLLHVWIIPSNKCNLHIHSLHLPFVIFQKDQNQGHLKDMLKSHLSQLYFIGWLKRTQIQT